MCVMVKFIEYTHTECFCQMLFQELQVEMRRSKGVTPGVKSLICNKNHDVRSKNESTIEQLLIEGINILFHVTNGRRRRMRKD